MSRRPLMVILAMIAALTLSGCGSSSGSDSTPAPVPSPTATQAEGFVPDTHGVYYEKLPDGYNLLCVYAGTWPGSNAGTGGPSCDWEGHLKWLESLPTPLPGG